jgi:hypothetical protein
MPETHTKDGCRASESREDIVGNPGFARSAGAGRNHNVRRGEFRDLVDGDLVVPHNLHREFRVNLAEPLNEVVSERIVVINQK